MRKALLLLSVLILGASCVTIQAQHTVYVAIDLETKEISVTNTPAIRETVPVQIFNLGSADPANLVLRLVRDGTVYAIQTGLTEVLGEDYCTGNLDLNTDELVDFFDGMSEQASRTFDFGLWDTSQNLLLANDNIDVMNNPYLDSMPGPSPINVQYITLMKSDGIYWAIGYTNGTEEVVMCPVLEYDSGGFEDDQLIIYDATEGVFVPIDATAFAGGGGGVAYTDEEAVEAVEAEATLDLTGSVTLQAGQSIDTQGGNVDLGGGALDTEGGNIDLGGGTLDLEGGDITDTTDNTITLTGPVEATDSLDVTGDLSAGALDIDGGVVDLQGGEIQDSTDDEVNVNDALAVAGALTVGGNIDTDGNDIDTKNGDILDSVDGINTFVGDVTVPGTLTAGFISMTSLTLGGGLITDSLDGEVEVDNNFKVNGTVDVAGGNLTVSAGGLDLIGGTMSGADLTDATVTEAKLDAAAQAKLNAAGTGLDNIVEDTTPQLGGSLDSNGQTITDQTDGEVIIDDALQVNGALDLVGGTLSGADLTAASIDEAQLDASVNTSLDLADAAMQDLENDTSPALGGSLDAAGWTISSSAGDLQLDDNVDINGSLDLVGGTLSGDDLTDATVGAEELEATAVSAGTYYCPKITVDADGRLTSAEDGSMEHDTTADVLTDDTYRGIFQTGKTAGEALSAWVPVYLETDGKWYQADADAAGEWPAMGLTCSSAVGDGSAVDILTDGIVRNDDWNWDTVGGEIYLSTAGGLTQTQPAGADVEQIIGYAISDDEICVNIRINEDTATSSESIIVQAFSTATESITAIHDFSATAVAMTETLDSGDDFNDSTDVFTAPETGNYRFSVTLPAYDTSLQTWCYAGVYNDTDAAIEHSVANGLGKSAGDFYNSAEPMSFTVVLPLTQSDEITLRAWTASGDDWTIDYNADREMKASLLIERIN